MSEVSSPDPAPRHGLRRGVALLAAAAALVLVLVASRGGDDRSSPRTPAALRSAFTVGRGVEATRVLPPIGPSNGETVIFLHGWGLVGPSAYSPWLEHLRRGGSTVLVPRYQRDLRTASSRVPDAVLAGVRGAVQRLPDRPTDVVVVGHSTGGVLALDYATKAPRARLPPARAVLAIYPGGALRDMPPLTADAAALPRGTRVILMASAADQVVGIAPAQRLYADAEHLGPRRELTLVDDPGATDHFAPARPGEAARRTFWPVADALIGARG